MRKAFADSLYSAAERNDRVAFLTSDIGFQTFDEFQRQFGSRYVNVGVAEAQLICVAAGMALGGWRPVAYAIASFCVARAFEFIRVSICYPRLPVILVGVGGGFTYANSGITHHASNDLGLMSLLPGMTVVAPGSPDEIQTLLPQLLELPGPTYFRIGKYGEKNYQAEEPTVLGKAKLAQRGEKVAVIATGDIILNVTEATAKLAIEGIKPIVYQMHTVKPLDTSMLDSLAKTVDTIIIVEEHEPYGGLFSAVSLWRAGREKAPKLVRLGAPDEMMLGNPTREELRKRIGCDTESIKETVRTVWYST